MPDGVQQTTPGGRDAMVQAVLSGHPLRLWNYDVHRHAV